MKKLYHTKLKLSGLFGALATLLCLCTLTGFLGAFWWGFEITSHFRLQYAIALSATAAFCIWRKEGKIAVIMVLFALVNAALFVPGYFSRPAEVGSPSPTLWLMQLNVRTSNRRSDLVKKFIQEKKPDVIVLEEVDDWWVEDLADLIKTYPNAITLPREDNFGIAVYSKKPLIRHRVLYLGEAQLPSLLIQIYVETKTVSILGTHAVPPEGPDNSELRNAHFRALGELLSDRKGLVVLMGDLNTTPWSPYFKKLLRDTGLVDSAQGYGVQPTWPVHSFPLWIPIDHCLVSPRLHVTRREVGRNVGSDHFPLLVEVAVTD